MRHTILQLIRFLVTGSVNTAVGLGTIYALVHIVRLPDVVANLVGYAVGLCVSFVLNRNWTFASKRSLRATAPRFLAVVALAYLANLATMLLLTRRLGWSIDWATLCAAVPYTVLFYLGSRWFVFRPAPTAAIRDGGLMRLEEGAR